MPGFDLSRLCAELFPKSVTNETIGMILMNHGIFSFGDSAKESYDRMIELVSMAEDYLDQQRALDVSSTYNETSLTTENISVEQIAQLRKEYSSHLKSPVILQQLRTPQTLAFANHPKISHISQQGPATPDHVIRTKQLPMLGFELESRINNYIENYNNYFELGSKTPHDGQEKNMLDPLPRIILDKKAGMITFELPQCIACGDCVAICPEGAISIVSPAIFTGYYKTINRDDMEPPRLFTPKEED